MLHHTWTMRFHPAKHFQRLFSAPPIQSPNHPRLGMQQLTLRVVRLPLAVTHRPRIASVYSVIPPLPEDGRRGARPAAACRWGVPGGHARKGDSGGTSSQATSWSDPLSGGSPPDRRGPLPQLLRAHLRGRLRRGLLLLQVGRGRRPKARPPTPTMSSCCQATLRFPASSTTCS